MMRIEDRLLFNEIKKGNKKLFEHLFLEYYPNLVTFAKSYLFDQQASEDLVQELFVHMWENTEDIKIHTSFKSYFYQAVKNRCLNHLQSLKITDKNNFLYIEASLATGDDVEFFDPVIFDSIQVALEELPEQMRKVFELKLLQGRKQKDIANELNISENTVKTHLKRAKVKLREILLRETHLLFFL